MDKTKYLLLFCFLVTESFAITQQQLNYIANSVKVEVKVHSNLEEEFRCSFTIKLMNGGTETVPNSGWEIHFCSIRLLFPKFLPFNAESAQIGSTNLNVSHVQGCLFKIYPDTNFKGFHGGSVLELPMIAKDWMVSRTDFMPNWYVNDEDDELAPVLMLSTRSEMLDFVQAFDSADAYKRHHTDQYNPYTLEDRYDEYSSNILTEDQISPEEQIIPTPWQIDLDPDSTVSVTDQWVVVADDQLEFESKYLADKLELSEDDDVSAKHRIHLKIVQPAQIKISKNCIFNEGMYQIVIKSDVIEVLGVKNQGVLYGVQSILSLLYKDMRTSEGFVYDCPRFQYRGMHVDVARNFHPKGDILTLLEVMSIYKMNKLHLHLTDDEGWRLEIPTLPELTDVGARSCHDYVGDKCLMPQLGHAPDTSGSKKLYYNVAEYKEILEYANDRHIEVIPEFDMPGHSHAAINAMVARYKRLMDEGDKSGAEEYLLSDLEDKSEYLSVQMFTDNAINPCLDSTFTFVEEVIKQVISIHQTIQPLKTFHFGGDEVPHNAWVDSPKCQEFLDQYNVTIGEERDFIKEHFITTVSEISASLGLNISGWEDGFLHNEEDSIVPYNLDKLENQEATAYAWNNIWEWGSGKRAYVFANVDYKVVLSHATNLYFDHPYEPDSEERGYYWATRYDDVFKTFKFNAHDVYENIEENRMGSPLTKEGFCESQLACPQLMKPGNVLGIQGQIWTETIRNRGQFNNMLYPRVLAVAERAWHQGSWELNGSEEEMKEEWKKFAYKLGMKELPRLGDLGVEYKIRPIGAKLASDGVSLNLNAEFPGLGAALSDNGGATWTVAKIGDNPVTPGQLYLLAATSTNGDRLSRAIPLEIPLNGFTNLVGSALVTFICLMVAFVSVIFVKI